MNAFDALLAGRGVITSDGACGTQLMKAGLPVGEAPETWNLTHPDQVGAVAKGYADAGAEIVLTNTLGGTRLKLASCALADRVADVNRAAAQIAKQAVAGRALVFASVGPTGQFMEPLGTMTEQDAIAAFAEQIEALVAGGVDGIAVESMTDLSEAIAAVKAAKAACDLPVAATMTFDHGPAGYATMMGVKPAQAARALADLGVAAVGSNCGAGMAQIVDIIGLMQPATDLPLWAKANAGLPELVDGRTVFREGPEEMAALVADLIRAGARVVGGCCGTTPAHIAAIRQEVEKAANKHTG